MLATATHTAQPRFATLRPILRQHGLLIAVVLVYATLAMTMAHLLAPRMDTDKVGTLMSNFLAMVPGMIYFVLMWRFIVGRYILRVPNLGQWLKADVTSALTDRHRQLSALVGLVLMVIVLLAFAQLKRLIPILQPFAWDQTFADLDQTLHFGTDPWRLVDAVLGHPFAVTIITGAYNYWLFLMYFSLVFTCFSTARPALRVRYLLAFLLTWAIGGNLIATLFSSAGPAYYALLGLGDHYEPLLSMLDHHAAIQPITVVESHDLLWHFYTAPNGMNGISAFPSMHVASTVLMTIYAWKWHRIAGIIFTCFSVVIMLGSVLLAWHYAVDGYAGALIAVFSWVLAGMLMRAFPAINPPRA